MSYIDQRGAPPVPSPTSLAQRADLTALSLSITHLSGRWHPETGAAQFCSPCKVQVMQMTDSDPAFVYRQDQGCIQAWNGRAWTKSAENVPVESLVVSSGWG